MPGGWHAEGMSEGQPLEPSSAPVQHDGGSATRGTTSGQVEPDELVVVSGPGSGDAAPAENLANQEETVAQPGKVMRIGSMTKQLLEEVRQAPLDARSRTRLREIYETSVKELSTALSPDLRAELASLALPFGDDDIPSEAELRIAQAQLVGWLEGLFHGIQATLFAQQMAAQAQLQQMRQRGLPPGMTMPDGMGADGQVPDPRPGTYL